MFKLSKVPLRGNDQYEGYSVDLAQKLSEILGFKYKIHIVSDGKYGSHVGNGVWNGMIKEILDGTADLAIADLTINNARFLLYLTTKLNLLNKINKRHKFSLYKSLHKNTFGCFQRDCGKQYILNVQIRMYSIGF